MRNRLLQSWQGAGLLGDRAAAIRVQQSQALARIISVLLGLSYLAAHSPAFMGHWPTWLVAAGLYIAIQLASLFWLHASPWSASRLLLLPLVDAAYTGLAMWMDGGHASPVQLFFYLIIFSNATRYGNVMLAYTQALSFLAMGVVGALSFHDPRLALDWPWLALQLAALAFIPAYAHGIGRRLEEAETGRARAETQSVSLLDGMPAPAFVYAPDEQGEPRILHANPAIGAISAWTPLTLAGHFVDAIAAPEDGVEMRRQCAQGLGDAGGAPRSFFVRGRDAQGEPRRLQCQVMPIHWQGKEAGLCLMADVTERDRLSENLDAAHRTGYVASLVAGLTHDFRNILTHILGNAEVLRMETGDEEFQQKLDVIIEAAERGSDMITHLLNISKPRQGSPSLFRLQDTLPPIVNLARVKLPIHVSLACKLADDLPPLLGQPAQIDQVILNLVDNAAHAIGDEEGDILIEADARAEHPLDAKDAPAIRIAVRDSGHGIAEEDLPNIFRPFWTSHAEDGGTGLGMAMVKRIVEWHHGKVDVDSAPGAGATITVWLPAATEAEARAPAAEPPARPARAAIGRLQPWRILLVDDDPEVLRVHASMLQRMGQQVVTAANGREGAEIFRARADDIDLVITDYRMPEMNGLEMIRAIRAIRPDALILMITGYGEDVDVRECVRQRAHVLHKPVSFQKLATEIGALQMQAGDAGAPRAAAK